MNHNFSSLNMKPLFKYQELRDLLESRFSDPNEGQGQRLQQNRKKDLKAMFLIQQAIHYGVFPLISATEFSHEAWEILQQDYIGDGKVISIKLKTLHHDIEISLMKSNDFFKDDMS